MPRMPQQNCNCGPGASDVSENIKLKVLEDRLKAELAPKDLSLLKEDFEIADGDFIYIYDTTEIDVPKRLKRVLLSKVRSIIVHDIEKEVSDFALRYELVSQLPVIGEHNVIYLVHEPNPSPEVDQDGKNNFSEYIWVDNAHGYEKFGAATIDLSAYRKAAAQDVIDNQIKQSVTNEVNRATAKENEIAGNLAGEVARASAAEEALSVRVTHIESDYLTSLDKQELQGNINSEISRATGAEQTLQGNIDAEETRAKGKENEIAGNLANEINRATAAENVLTQNLQAEVSRAQTKEGLLDAEDARINQALLDEITRATGAEETIQGNVDAEVSRAEGAEATLQAHIDAEEARAEGIEADHESRIAAIEADYLVAADKTELQGNIDAEEARAIAAEGALDTAKADKATTLAGYGITDAYTKTKTDELLDDKADKSNTYTKSEVYTKQETESAIDAKLQSTFRYKGSVQTYSQLPASGNVVGDVWNIEQADPSHSIEAGDNVAWNGSSWDKFGGELAVDSALSAVSTNPVQNKVITEALQNQTSSPISWGNTTVAVGGIPAGTNMGDKTVLEILQSLLYPYVAIKNASLGISPSTGTYLEKGATITPASLSASVVQGSKPTTDITLKILKDGTQIATGTGTSLSHNLDGTSYNEDTYPSFTMTASDGDTNLSASAPTYTWLFKSYHGVVASSITSPTAAQIQALTGELLTKSSRSFGYNMVGQKCVYAYPASYGALSAIYDANNFLVTGSFDVSTVSITNANGVTTDYKVYILKDAVTANMTYRFQF